MRTSPLSPCTAIIQFKAGMASALLMLSALCNAAAPEWIVVIRNPLTQATSSYDISRARQAGAMLDLWTKAEGTGHKPAIVETYRRDGFSPAQVQIYEERFAWRLTKWRVDCAKWSMKLLATADYDAGGEAYLSNQVAGEEGVIFPGSVVDIAADRMCKGLRVRK